MRQNVIVSQGGKTGDAHGTYLRDTNVSEAVAAAIPPALVHVASEPGRPTPQPQPIAKPAAKQSVPPPSSPTPQPIAKPASLKALRRWSAPKLTNLAEQEGIEAEGLGKDGLRAILATHLGLK